VPQTITGAGNNAFSMSDSPVERPLVEFWSSTECAGFLDGLTGELGKRGWIAQQHFGVPQAQYRSARSASARFAMRWGAYGSYPVKVGLRFSRARPGTIGVVCTNTFYAPRCALFAAPSDVPIIHWVWDLFPDVLVAAGVIKAGGGLERLAHGIVRRTFDGAAANVFLGEKLLRYTESKFGPIPRSQVIPIGADASPFLRPPQPREQAAEDCRILYCGNLGRMHDVATIVGAMGAGLPAGLRLDFRGNGEGFRAIDQVVAESGVNSRIQLGGHMCEGEWVETMKSADVALVTMRPGAEGLVIPSKTYSAMVAGQAVLAVCPEGSDLADLVRRHDVGWVIPPGDVAGLGIALKRLVEFPAEVSAKRANAWRVGHERFGQQIIASAWSELLHHVSAENTPVPAC